MVALDHVNTPTVVRRNRRAYPRLVPGQLGWLERVRVMHGPAVSLIDLSMHGAFFEVDYRLRPGDATNFELVATHDRTIVTGHIVRTEISGLSADGVRYRGACEFDRPLPWRHQLSAPELPLALPLFGTGYQPWWGWSEIRLISRHGRLMRGYTRGFHMAAPAVNLWPSRDASDRDRQAVPLSHIRTITFVRDLDEEGRLLFCPSPDDQSLHPVEVTFRNNDVMRGATTGYEPGQMGFWIFPPAQDLDQVRVFAVSSSVREICFF
jgi:hypothetical protein